MLRSFKVLSVEVVLIRASNLNFGVHSGALEAIFQLDW